MNTEQEKIKETFETENDPDYVRKLNRRAELIAFAFFALLAGLGLLITWQAFVFFELIIVIACIGAHVHTARQSCHYELRFEGDQLQITDVDKAKSYVVYDVPQSDFVINQGKSEVERDYCGLAIKNTVFLI